jgi:hypothetical protein
MTWAASQQIARGDRLPVCRCSTSVSRLGRFLQPPKGCPPSKQRRLQTVVNVATDEQVYVVNNGYWACRNCRCRSRGCALQFPDSPGWIRLCVFHCSQGAGLSTQDSKWDAKYEQPMAYGVAWAQGPRESMEDYASVVPRGRCGFLVACVLRARALLSPVQLHVSKPAGQGGPVRGFLDIARGM